MPQMGETIFEGTITKWLKKVGEKSPARRAAVRNLHGQSTRKSPRPAGVLLEIRVQEGHLPGGATQIAEKSNQHTETLLGIAV
jgi:2-oxoglutarate dehydrogenase E2 component (dihydrolipoamide succinyltransferase)